MERTVLLFSFLSLSLSPPHIPGNSHARHQHQQPLPSLPSPPSLNSSSLCLFTSGPSLHIPGNSHAHHPMSELQQPLSSLSSISNFLFSLSSLTSIPSL